MDKITRRRALQGAGAAAAFLLAKPFSSGTAQADAAPMTNEPTEAPYPVVDDAAAARLKHAQDLLDTISLEYEHTSVLSYLASIEQVGFNERVTIANTRDLPVYRLKGRNRLGPTKMEKVHGDDPEDRGLIEIPRVTVGFHIEGSENRSDILWIAEGVNHLNDKMMHLYLDLVQYAQPAQVDTLNKAITEVRQVSRDFDVAIAGNKTTLEGALKDPRFLPETNKERLDRGLLGSYWGARAVVTPRIGQTGGVNELLVLGRDAGKVVFFGAPIMHEWYDETDGTEHYIYRRDIGMAVHRPYRTKLVAV
jgi:hypothetical protein